MKEKITFVSKSPAKRKDGTEITGKSAKTGKEWKLYNLIDDKKRKFSTFDGGLFNAIPLNKEIEINYTEEEKDGFTNRTIVPEGSRKLEEAEREEKIDRVLTGVRELYKQNEKILKILNTVFPKNEIELEDLEDIK